MFVRFQESCDSLDEVIHVGERPCLRPVAEDGDLLAAQRLRHELRQHPSVVQAHPRAVGVEDPRDLRVDSVRAVIRHRERFREAFRLVVHPAQPHRVDVPAIVLFLRVHVGVPVDFARARQQEPCLLFPCQSQRLVRAQGPHLQDLDGEPREVRRTRRTRKVQDVVHASRQEHVLRHVLLDEPEALVPRQVRDVVHRPRQQVVDARDAVSLRQEPVAQVTSQETRAARHHRMLLSHGRSPIGLEFTPPGVL